jgi:hypothetical protein
MDTGHRVLIIVFLFPLATHMEEIEEDVDEVYS